MIPYLCATEEDVCSEDSFVSCCSEFPPQPAISGDYPQLMPWGNNVEKRIKFQCCGDFISAGFHIYLPLSFRRVENMTEFRVQFMSNSVVFTNIQLIDELTNMLMSWRNCLDKANGVVYRCNGILSTLFELSFVGEIVFLNGGEDICVHFPGFNGFFKHRLILLIDCEGGVGGCYIGGSTTSGEDFEAFEVLSEVVVDCDVDGKKKGSEKEHTKRTHKKSSHKTESHSKTHGHSSRSKAESSSKKNDSNKAKSGEKKIPEETKKTQFKDKNEQSLLESSTVHRRHAASPISAAVKGKQETSPKTVEISQVKSQVPKKVESSKKSKNESSHSHRSKEKSSKLKTNSVSTKNLTISVKKTETPKKPVLCSQKRNSRWDTTHKTENLPKIKVESTNPNSLANLVLQSKLVEAPKEESKLSSVKISVPASKLFCESENATTPSVMVISESKTCLSELDSSQKMDKNTKFSVNLKSKESPVDSETVVINTNTSSTHILEQKNNLMKSATLSVTVKSSEMKEPENEAEPQIFYSPGIPDIPKESVLIKIPNLNEKITEPTIAVESTAKNVTEIESSQKIPEKVHIKPFTVANSVSKKVEKDLQLSERSLPESPKTNVEEKKKSSSKKKYKTQLDNDNEEVYVTHKSCSPGQWICLISQGTAEIGRFRATGGHCGLHAWKVIDEADRMLRDDKQRWIKSVTKLENCQKLLFSATLTHEPDLMLEIGLKNPKLFSSADERRIFVKPSLLKEYYIVVDENIRPLAVVHMLTRQI
ncbi:uncharacterized protein LOC115228932 [Octopus sinensis]|uniref:Uncharacterized protein LOC115228932 n=1 Tax=Octopus sinensis TaxID=2607531 RepID=A0A7E6EI32_9MOLL|nr:uncharacterized protein LOC115228932 [Octopus sinensis]